MKPPIQRFFELVDKQAIWDGVSCWLWQGKLTHDGYGRFGSDSRQYAHRYAYDMVVGQIPEGMELDHLCETPACVNPAHLKVVTHRANLLRGNSFSGVNARKLYCKRGHPFDGTNTYVRPNGHRNCRTCHREDRIRAKV